MSEAAGVLRIQSGYIRSSSIKDLAVCGGDRSGQHVLGWCSGLSTSVVVVFAQVLGFRGVRILITVVILGGQQ